MSQTRADLDNAIADLQTKANDTLTAANNTQQAVQAAANRVSALPPNNDDFQNEVDAIGVISGTLDQIITVAGQTKAVADNILPAP